MDRPTLQIRRISTIKPEIPLPAYATEGAAGFDLRADIADNVIIESGRRSLISTGLTMAVPAGFELQIRPRSGLAAKFGVTVLNTPGTVDSDYRGEVMVILANFGDQPFQVSRGDRIAQAVLARTAKAEIMEVDTLDATERGAGGFGSTGVG